MAKSDKPFAATPGGIRQALGNDTELINALAGRISAMGLGHAAVTSALRSAIESCVADPAQRRVLPDAFRKEAELTEAFQDWIDGHSVFTSDCSAMLCASSDEAIEFAICEARRRKGPNGFKIVSLIGSDHGRTAACRTASGRPELHDGYGPMIAGFVHVPPNHIDGLKVAVDGSTAAVLIAPIDLSEGALPIDEEFLLAARELCDEHDALLIIDEQSLCVGSTGMPFSFNALSDGSVHADVVIASAGLFAGLSGAALLAGQRLTDHAVADHATEQDAAEVSLHPFQRAVAIATLRELTARNAKESTADLAASFAGNLAEAIGGFSFVRDVNVCGFTIGIQTDLPASDLVEIAAKEKLLLEPAGDTSVLLQPPPTLDESDQELLLERLTTVFESLESRAATAIADSSEQDRDASSE